MKMQEVRNLGRKFGLKFPVGTTKVQAIRMIQKAEGYFDCFARAENGYCSQKECLFYEECLKLSKK